jgi:hypothetical protein
VLEGSSIIEMKGSAHGTLLQPIVHHLFDIDELAVEINELWLLYRWYFDLTCDSGIADTETA